jgi:glycosyltransferase involved in cell wall biosynthesis
VRDAIVRVAEGRADARAAVEAQRALARELTWDRLARRYVEVFNAIH